MSFASALEERVLGLKFDNRQFEEGAKESLDTLDNLKKNLEFDESSKGLDVLGASFKNLPLGNISEALEAITGKFSIMGTIGDQIIRRLTDGFLNLGSKITGTVKDLTLNQITAGFGKYGEKTSAVQTIMAATAKDFTDTGEQMEYVNDQLSKLNWFTDETSYNFVDMVSNIGKFTSNNIKLDKSVTAMQGIATWAAVSGANAGEASRAMYNLSQAIATGSVKLIDWKSIENANMATAGFKETVIETAVSMGTLKKAGDGVYKTLKGNKVSVSNFNEALSDAWFSSEVLLSSLEKYGGFTDVLYDLSEATGETATELLDVVSKYKSGSLDVTAFASKTGTSAEYIKEKLDILSSAEMELGQKSFRAAQEAKTFQEAIDATKDAVSTGWMQTFEIIFGNYEEAKVLWTNVANELWDIFASSAEARNELLGEWKEAGGRDALFEGIANSWKIVKDLIEPVKNAFSEIFPPMTSERLVKISEAFRDLTDKIANATIPITKAKEALKGGLISDSGITEKIDNTKFFVFQRVLSDIGTTARGVFNALKLGGQAIGAVAKGFSPLVKAFGTFIAQIFKITSGFDGFIDGVRESANQLGTFESITKRISSVTQILADHLVSFIEPMVQAFKSGGGGLTGLVNSLFEAVKHLVTLFFDLASAVTGIDFNKFGKGISNFIGLVGGFVVKGLGRMIEILRELPGKANAAFEQLTGKSIRESFDDLKVKASSAFDTIGDKLGKLSELFAKAKDGIVNFFKSFKKDDSKSAEKTTSVFEKMGTALAKAWAIIKVVAAKIGEAFGKLRAAFKESFSGFSLTGNAGLMDLVNGGLFAGLLVGLNKITKAFKSSELSGILGKVKDFLGGFGDVLESVKKNLDAFASKTNSEAIKNIAISIGILAASIAVLALINPEKLNSSLSALTTVFVELIAAIKILDKGDKKKSNLGNLATTMIKMAAAILILSFALAEIASIDSGNITTALFAIGALMLEIAAFSKIIEKNKGKTANIGKGVISLAIGLRILVSSVKSIAELDVDSLQRGLLGVSVILMALAAFSRVADLDDMGLSSGTGMILFAAAMNILAKAVEKFSKMDSSAMEAGLIGVGAVLGELAIFTRLTGNSKHVLSTAVGLTVISAAMLIFANVIQKFGNMEWQKLALGLGALAAVLLSVAVAVKLMDGSLSGAAAMIVVAAALSLLCPVLMKLGDMSLKQIGSSLLMIAGVFLTLGVAGMALKPMVPTILALTGAIILLGVGMAGIGAGLMLISTGLAGLGASLAIAAGSILASLDIIIAGCVKLIIGITVALIDGLKTLAASIIGAAPAVFTAVKVLVLGILDVLRAIVPPLVEVGLMIVISLLKGVADNIGTITMAALLIIVGFIEGISAGMDMIVQAAFDLVINFVNSVANAIRDNSDVIIEAIRNLLGAIIEFVLTALQGLFKGLPGVGKKIYDGLEEVKQNIRSEFSEKEGEETAKEYMGGVQNGVERSESGLKKASAKTGKNAKESLKEAFSGTEGIGAGAVTSFIGGMMGQEGAAVDASNLLGENVAGGLDISDMSGQAGELSVDAYLEKFGIDPSEYGFNMGKSAADGAKSAIPEWEKAGYDSEEAYRKALLEGKNHSETGEKMAEETAKSAGGSKALKMMSDSGTGSTKAYSKGVEDSISNVTDSAAKLPEEASKTASSSKAIKMMSDSGSGATNAYAKAMESEAKSKLPKSGENLPKTAAKGAKSNASELKVPGGMATAAYNSGLNNNLSGTRTKGAKLATTAAAGARSKNGEFNTVGYNGAIGFGNGLGNSEAANYIKRKAREMAQNALNAAKAQMQEQSPSKAMRKIGAYGAEGFAIGLSSLNNMVERAAKEVSSEALDVMNNAASTISKLIDSDIDVNPVITPVLDLSNIQNGAGYIDGLLSNQRAISLAASTKIDESGLSGMMEHLDLTVDKALRRMMDAMEETNKQPININVPLTIDKRQFARATATTTREELNRIDYLNNRKAGIA